MSVGKPLFLTVVILGTQDSRPIASRPVPCRVVLTGDP